MLGLALPCSIRETCRYGQQPETLCRTEEQAAAYIKANVTKPVVSLIVGRNAPAGKSLGHAGAIVSGNVGTAATKIAALQDAGVYVVKSPGQLVERVSALLKKEG